MEDQTYTDESTDANDYDVAHLRTQSARLGSAMHTTDSADAITELLVATGIAINKKQGKTAILPHLFVVCGDKREKVGVGKATWNEHVAALCRMTKVVEVPGSWRVHIIEHIHQLATMATY